MANEYIGLYWMPRTLSGRVQWGKVLKPSRAGIAFRLIATPVFECQLLINGVEAISRSTFARLGNDVTFQHPVAADPSQSWQLICFNPTYGPKSFEARAYFRPSSKAYGSVRTPHFINRTNIRNLLKL